jgi:hypothetical protein
MRPLSGWIARRAVPPTAIADRSELKDVGQAAYDSADEAVVAEMLRLAEVRQAALLQMAAAADARAVQVVAGCAALAAAGIGAAAALQAASAPGPLALAAGSAGIGFTLAAGFAAWAARPEPGYLPPGLEPDQVWDQSVLSAPARHLKMIAVGQAQRSIAVAAQGTVARGRAMKAALLCATFTPMVSAMVWVAVRVVAGG